MALKPTIYKFKIDLTDLEREVYQSLNLTLARHPSETLERMMTRVLAFCLNAQDQLLFCKGLSDTDEPDLWAHSLDGKLQLWIEVGEPTLDRIKKSSRLATTVKVYCFNNKANTWWELNRSGLAELPVSIVQLQWDEIQTLANMVERTMDFSITVSGDSAYVATAAGECELSLLTRQ